MKPKGAAILIGLGAPPKGKGMSGDEMESDAEAGDEGTEALSGTELAKAIKSGDGQRIFDAMESIIKEVVHKHDKPDDAAEVDDSSD